MFTTRTRIAFAATAIATALLAAACSGNSDKSDSGMSGMQHSATSAAAPTRTDFNDADVTFLQMMYPHHAQAVEMAQLVPSRSQNPDLLALAAAVEKAQSPEMQRFADLLRSFGKPAPSASGHMMSGMMTPEQMSALRAASGADFDRQWLTMMIEHHSGAITMARTELSSGINNDAKQLATGIAADQQREIDTMRGMLAKS
ncbi:MULTISPECIES: DUF305 domain-containing protein [Nocardia]|uniref:DUF305 domain-containing protein n=1 Tax=Nocardia arthritidis TaxID=228602 RepID=A0A6G9YRC5_9NOCA|nr:MULTISPECIES: DUF305 domain-containing protein [Nocardia]QIS15647.1 DUF305 domain-containing protein [Nocardia arthritidis]